MFKQIKIYKTRFKTIKAMRFCEISIEENGVFDLFHYLEWAFSDLTKKVKDEKEKFEIAIMICSYVNKYSEDIEVSNYKEQAIYELSQKWLTYHFPTALYDKHGIDKIYKLDLEEIVIQFYGIRNEYFYQKLIFDKENGFEIEKNIEIINHLVNYVYDEPCFDFYTKGDTFKYAISYDELTPQTNFLADEKFIFKKMRLYNDLEYQINAKNLVSKILNEINIEKYYDYELYE